MDIFREKLKADRNIIHVLLTLSFFPIILAGPIQRPILLLPQIKNRRFFNYDFATAGLKQILWGLFMKIVIADNCAVYVNDIFQNYTVYNASTLVLGGILYTVQIYTDFAGYSEIAIGVAKLFGFDLMRNFAFPYFASNIAEFWRRWHISLTSWFREYLFLPIAYSVSRKIPSEHFLFIRTDLFIYIVGISITWLLTGLWHGANLTFVVWGFIHGFFLIVYQVQKKPRKRFLSKWRIRSNNFLLTGTERFMTLIIVIAAWVIFRADNMSMAVGYLKNLFSTSLFSIPNVFPTKLPFLILFLFIAEWIQKDKGYVLDLKSLIKFRYVRWFIYYFLILLIFWFSGSDQKFIYFQF